MTYLLWKYLLEDDVENFRQYLARATYTHGPARASTASPGGIAFKIGSPGALGTSPKTPKQKKSPFAASGGNNHRGTGVLLSRSDINARDKLGRTLLHHAASSNHGTGVEFVKILVEIPVLDLYAQDFENGWTALHRALYAGNVEIAHLLLAKDGQIASDFTSSVMQTYLGGLIKIKDFEGNSPFEVFASTIASRSLISSSTMLTLDAGDDESVNSMDDHDELHEIEGSKHVLRSRFDVAGDEVFTFGSNKNLSLGLGDEDDRQYPERIHLERPDHLLLRLYEDYLQAQQGRSSDDIAHNGSSVTSLSEIPCVVRNQPIIIQDVVMSKMHTAVLTSDPISNLYVCGFGPGGRLGFGDETTRFNYMCLTTGGLAKRKVIAVALGHYHTIALCSTGEVFTWGSNKYGQLGYTLPEVPSKEIPMQLTPRQLYGLVKKEQIIGAAASSVHSVIYSAVALYTFGKNVGQLGLVDADARSLAIQTIPRRVGTSILQAAIKTVTAIDRATAVLLENHDVVVFTQFAWKKVVFPLEEGPNMFFSQALRTCYNREPNSISKITSGGDTICALSSFGQVFTIEVPQESENVPSNVSTTNPNKARNALPNPSSVWCIGKSHMSAVDVAVGQDGSIILCASSGAVWRKEKRAQIKSVTQKAFDRGRVKDYKFTRVPNLTRAVAVRSNAFGAFAAIRKDCHVTREQMVTSPPGLWQSIFPLLSFHSYGASSEVANTDFIDESRLGGTDTVSSNPAQIKKALMSNPNAESDFLNDSQLSKPLSDSPFDVWVTSSLTDVRLPVHSFILKARSRVLRNALVEFQQSYFFCIPDVLTLEYGHDGHIHLRLERADFLTVVNLVFYLYSDNVVDVWSPSQTSKALHLAPRYRQIRVELMKIADFLELRSLERAARLMVDPVKSMMLDFEAAYLDLDFWAQADVVIDLASDAETPAHSAVLCSRCPFFEGLFHGRAGGLWTLGRRNESDGLPEPIRVDLKHIEENIFLMVLRHIYADTGEELFDDLVCADIDSFLDLVIEVTSVANELMLDRLAQVCQKVLGRYVTIRNVCGLLNTIAECSVTDFKDMALEYICLNLESMLEHRLLDELDEYLMEELDLVVQANQLAFMPFVRSGRTEAELLDRYPQLAELLEQDRQRRIDAMRLPTRSARHDERSTPRRKSAPAEEEMPFNMDDDAAAVSPRVGSETASPSIRPSAGGRHFSNLTLGTALEAGRFSPTSVDTEPFSMPTPLHDAVATPPSGMGISNLELPRAAWKTSAPQDSKIDFRSIMEQTTNSRVSTLTQAMATAAGPSSQTKPKMSQKERRKKQQELRQQEVSVKSKEETPASPSSPWTKVAPVPRRSVTSPLSGVTPTSTDTSDPAATRPNMTMRQTVAGTQQIPKGESSKPLHASPMAKAQSPQPVPPQIQSIRHTPMPPRSSSGTDAHTSMADILAQQQGEKIAIKEAAARRSLQEIQQEQEFQEWWDQESRRVQEEEEQTRGGSAAAVAATRHTKSGRGARGPRKRGSGRGGTNAPAASHQQHDKDANAQTRSAASEGSNSRGRGHGRRGRGKTRHEQAT